MKIYNYIFLSIFSGAFSPSVFSQQLYSFNTWSAGSTSYTKTVTSPNNTMTVTYSEVSNYRANTLCGGCVCIAGTSTPSVPFYYNQATMYIADYSSSSCYCSGNGGERGLILAANWPNNTTKWEQIDIVFSNSVCAPVTFSIWDINQNYFDDGSQWPYFTDKVDISALDNNNASISSANISISACGNTVTTSGNTKTITGVLNSCVCWTHAISIGASGTWVKQITLRYYAGGSTYSTDPWSQYIIVTDISGCNSNTVLPIQLESFTGQCFDNKKIFNWSTATEINNDFFTLERSKNGFDFSETQKINGSGNSSVQKKYEIALEEDGLDYTYYRLKQTDFDGQFSYSSIIHVSCFENYYDGISLFPSPATDEINIHFESVIDTEIEYTITDVFGRTVKQEAKIQSGNEFAIDAKQLTGGVYFFRLIEKQGINSFPALRFIKQ